MEREGIVCCPMVTRDIIGRWLVKREGYCSSNRDSVTLLVGHG